MPGSSSSQADFCVGTEKSSMFFKHHTTHQTLDLPTQVVCPRGTGKRQEEAEGMEGFVNEQTPKHYGGVEQALASNQEIWEPVLILPLLTV